jgi:hypothetical protein
MSFFRVHRRFAAWLAMCVMVFGALAPAVAQAMVSASDRGPWIEVCGASGMVWIKAEGVAGAGDQMPEPDSSMGDMVKHCPWCSIHGGAAALPVHAAHVPSLTPAEQSFAEPATVAFATKPPRSQQARAPPVLL